MAIRRFPALAVAVLLAWPAGVLVAAPAAAGTACVPPAVAHRGDSARAPENTLPAVRKALQAGVSRLEVDVRFTSNDVPVLLHDATVDRTTNGSGQVSSLTKAQVRALDAGSWFGRRYAGVRIPTLRTVLDYGRTRGAYFLIELKTLPKPQQMDNFLNELRWLGMLNRVRVTSFDQGALLAVRAAQPGLATALIDGPRYRSPSSVLQYGRTYLVHHNSVTQQRMQRWSRAGIDVRPWTVDTRSGWRRMAYNRAGAVVTNRPQAYLAWARERCGR